MADVMGRSQQDAGSQAWKGVYLATMAVAPVEMEAAKFAGITIDSVRRARLADPQFAQEEADAISASVALLFVVIWDLAIKGNVTALIFLLKTLAPAQFGQPTEVTGVGGGPVKVSVESPRERLEARFIEIDGRTGGSVNGQ